MDATTYQAWRSLHLRAARGESLTPEEQATYEAGKRELEAEEKIGDPREEARQAQAAVAGLAEEQEKLKGRRRELDAEIARLESLLGEPTRQFLNVKD